MTADQTRREQWLATYRARTNPWLSGLALVFLVTFSIQSIWPDKHEPWYVAMTWFSNILWVLFAVDLLVRFVVTVHKRHFFRRNWLDTITVVIPQFRALRVLRAFTSNGILSKSKGTITGGAVATATIGTLIIVWVGSLMVLNAERHAQHGEIKNIGQAIWWSFETITTVGYGDFVPVTPRGRTLAILIMLLGISVLGVVTAAVASWATHPARAAAAASAAPPHATHDTSAHNDLLAEVRELKAMVASLQATIAATTPATTTPATTTSTGATPTAVTPPSAG